MSESTPVPASALRDFSRGIFMAVGATVDSAETVTNHLIEASLRGVDSHGISRIPVYAEGVIAGDIDPTGSPRIVKEGPTSALLDGRRAFGQVAAGRAVEIAISKAKESGMSAVGIKNLNHVGMLSLYGERIAREELVAKLYTSGMARVAPYGSSQRVFGTNPICFAFPAPGREPIAIDIATAVAAAFKIVLAEKEGRQIPEGWAIDSSGKSTSNPKEALEGALLPLAGYKGYGLGLSVEIMSSILTGAPLSVNVKPIPYTQGGFLVEAMRVDTFRSKEEYGEELDRLVRLIKQSKVAKGFLEILLPGEPEMKVKAKRLAEGIPVRHELWEDFHRWSEKLSVPPPMVS